GRDQRVRGLLARRQSVRVGGVEREERAAVLQEDPRISGDHARAELPVEALDQRDRVAVRIGRGDGDRVALDRRAARAPCHPSRDPPAPFFEASRIETALYRDGSEGRVREIAVAVLEGEL